MKKLLHEAQSIVKELVNLVNRYEHLPCACEYQQLNHDGAYSLSLTSLSGSPRVQEDITGDYMGEVPFALYLRVAPDDSDDRIDCEQFLNELAAYLENHYKEIILGAGRNVEELEQTQNACLINRTENYNDYQVILTLRYNAKNIHGDR